MSDGGYVLLFLLLLVTADPHLSAYGVLSYSQPTHFLFNMLLLLCCSRYWWLFWPLQFSNYWSLKRVRQVKYSLFEVPFSLHAWVEKPYEPRLFKHFGHCTECQGKICQREQATSLFHFNYWGMFYPAETVHQRICHAGLQIVRSISITEWLGDFFFFSVSLIHVCEIPPDNALFHS